MAQFDPIVPKSGILTVLSSDTLRADRVGSAFTITGPVAGDACQVSGALVLGKAVNTSASPIVGIYDGETGAVVRKGVVVATFKSGLTLANGDAVYLSATAGALTNVKPTADMLHEVGVVVDATNKKILLQQKPVIALEPTPPAALFFADFGNVVTKWVIDGSSTDYTMVPVGPSLYQPIFDGTYVWVTTQEGPGRVCRLNPQTGEVVVYSTSCNYPPICCDSTSIWVGNYYFGTKRIERRDFNGNIVDTWDPGHSVNGLCVDPEGHLWVYDYNGYLYRWRISDHTLVKTVSGIDGGEALPSNPCLAGGNIWVGTNTKVHKVRRSDGTLLGSYPSGVDWCYAVAFDGTRIWQASARGYIQRWTEADGTFLGNINTVNWSYGGKNVAIVDSYVWVTTTLTNLKKYDLGGNFIGDYPRYYERRWLCANRPLIT